VHPRRFRLGGSSAPLVTIGIPTYNGERYLAMSIDSLLRQDYPSIELVISDNCSTDRTAAIAQAYAQNSDRIRYVRQSRNLGVVANFNVLLSLARGTYFMWAADHDLWEPTLVSKCVAALEGDPAAVLAYPQSFLIDETGTVIEEMDDQIELEEPSALCRYKRLIWRLDVCNMIYGVARLDALVATGGFPDAFGPDHVVLARLVLLGPILRVPGHLYLRRQNRPPESPDVHRQRALADLYPSNGSGWVSRPAHRLYEDLRHLHVLAVGQSSLSFVEKLDATVATLACFRQRFGVPSLLVRLLRVGARVARQRTRLDRHFGVGVGDSD
jgi:glycosyltransferase involved in cell wall biosynthesis